MFSWRYLLLPFSWIFALGLWIRDSLYRLGWLKSTQFPIAVIGIGNIRVGGTGKSPFTEFLIRLLAPRFKLATLSRGYGRKSKGFLWVDAPDARLYGDEPSQFKRKFPAISVSVGEDRRQAIDQIGPPHEVVLLDDSFQHRRVKPGFSWVLIEYADLSKPFLVYPAGNYREGVGALKRAEAVLITKCPGSIAKNQGQTIRSQLKLGDRQPLFFSTIHYLPIRKVVIELTEGDDPGLFGSSLPEQVLLVTAIAQPQAIEKHLTSQKIGYQLKTYPDHHYFTAHDLVQIGRAFDQISSALKIILTTEKDAERFRDQAFRRFIRDYPVYFLPIEFQIQADQLALANELMIDYVKSTI